MGRIIEWEAESADREKKMIPNTKRWPLWKTNSPICTSKLKQKPAKEKGHIQAIQNGEEKKS